MRFVSRKNCAGPFVIGSPSKSLSRPRIVPRRPLHSPEPQKMPSSTLSLMGGRRSRENFDDVVPDSPKSMASEVGERESFDFGVLGMNYIPSKRALLKAAELEEEARASAPAARWAGPQPELKEDSLNRINKARERQSQSAPTSPTSAPTSPWSILHPSNRRPSFDLPPIELPTSTVNAAERPQRELSSSPRPKLSSPRGSSLSSLLRGLLPLRDISIGPRSPRSASRDKGLASYPAVPVS